MWDLATGKVLRAVQCGEATPPTAVAVLPSRRAETGLRLWVACGSELRLYELPAEGGALVVREPARVLASASDDEINALDTRDRGAEGAFVDDAGGVAVLDLASFSVRKRMRGGHANVSTCVAFRAGPRPRGGSPWDLVSGGCDAALRFWESVTGIEKHRILFSDVATVAAASRSRASSGNSQFVNPPFVYSLAFAPHRPALLAAGLGSGAVALVDTADSVTLLRLLGDGIHRSSVCGVAWTPWAPTSSAPSIASGASAASAASVAVTDEAASESLLVSAGSEGQVLVWDVRGLVDPPKPVDKRRATARTSGRGGGRRGGAASASSAPGPRSGAGVDGDDGDDGERSDASRVLCRLEHGVKPNGIALGMVAMVKEKAEKAEEVGAADSATGGGSGGSGGDAATASSVSLSSSSSAWRLMVAETSGEWSSYEGVGSLIARARGGGGSKA